MSKFLPDELEKLLKTSGVSYKRKSRSFHLDCPRCGKRNKLWILTKNGAFICWYCAELEGFKGWAPDALAEILGRPAWDIRRLLYDGYVPSGNELALELSDFDDDLIDIDVAPPIDEIEWPWDTVALDSAAGRKGREYLEGRGIPLGTAMRYQIVYWPSKQRVMFPVFHQGKLVGYQGRTIISGVEPKILTSTGLRRESVVMFEQNLTQKHAIVCEGPVDAIKTDLCGGGIATMGKAVTKYQIDLIRSHGVDTIYLALDPDAAEEAHRLVRELGDLDTYLLLPPKGKKDLGECEFEEVWEAFHDAERFSPGSLFFDLKIRA